jgi:hypothetical protein
MKRKTASMATIDLTPLATRRPLVANGCLEQKNQIDHKTSRALSL